MVKVLAIILVLCLFGCGGSGGSSGNSSSSQVSNDPDQPLLIYVVNNSHLSTGEVQIGTAAVQRQLNAEVHAAYNISSTLVLADPPSEDSYRIYLQDNYQGDSNSGYHDGVHTAWSATPEGWTEIFSHEVIEMQLGNVCDPVQRPYSSPPVENFLLPGGTGYLESKGL